MVSGRAALLLGAAALVLLGGYQIGAQRVQGRWDAAELQREQQIQIREAQARRNAHAAGTVYEATRSARQAALPGLRDQLRTDLATPACPGASDARQLADLPVPAAAVDRLRRAAATGLDP